MTVAPGNAFSRRIGRGCEAHPAAVEGPDEDERKAFFRAYTTLRRIELFLSLPLGELDKLALQQRLDEIGRKGATQSAI